MLWIFIWGGKSSEQDMWINKISVSDAVKNEKVLNSMAYIKLWL
jgi:hypothetical protein